MYSEILMHFEKQRKLWPVFQTWKYHAGRKKLKKKLKPVDLYHLWLETEVEDVNLYMSDPEVDVYNDAQYGLQTEAQNENRYMFDPYAPAMFGFLGAFKENRSCH
jgi:hypothetical protein